MEIAENWLRQFRMEGGVKKTPKLYTKFTGECDHPHVHALFTANGSSECSSIRTSVGDC